MKKLLLLAVLITQITYAQRLLFTPTSLDFGTVVVPQTKQLVLNIENDYHQQIEVTAIEGFDIYGNKVFTANPAVFTLNVNETKDVTVTFSPEHNIAHLSQLVVVDNYRGAYGIEVKGNGKYIGYYSSTFNKSQEDLKSALKSAVSSGYNSLGYAQARDRMFMNIDNKKVNGQGASVNTLEGVYTGTVITGFSNRQAAQGQGFNTEHTFPQGFFSQNEPMRSDLHHLFPTKSSANSARGNMKFGVVSGSSNWSEGGSKRNSNFFEPRNEQKGQVARAMMYFVLRYQDYSNHFAPQESTLRNWHNQFPVNSIDEKRNSDIYSYQNNRNPFIDYPQFIERIEKLVGNSTAQVNWDYYYSHSSMDVSQGDELDNEVRVVYVNSGNQDVTLSNYTTSGNLSVVSPTTSELVKPGERVEFLMNITKGTGGNGELSFQTTNSSISTVKIPIVLPAITSTTELVKGKNRLSYYPNPASDVLRLTSGVKHVALYNISGQKLLEKVVSSSYKLSVSEYPSGMYFLEMKGEFEVKRQALMIH